jgi:hypothetical protein
MIQFSFKHTNHALVVLASFGYSKLKNCLQRFIYFYFLKENLKKIYRKNMKEILSDIDDREYFKQYLKENEPNNSEILDKIENYDLCEKITDKSISIEDHIHELRRLGIYDFPNDDIVISNVRNVQKEIISEIENDITFDRFRNYLHESISKI